MSELGRFDEVDAAEESLIAFAESQRCTTFPLGEGELLSLGDMEILYVVSRRDDEWFQVGRENRGNLRAVLRADHYVDALKYVTYRLAAATRSERGLPFLRVLSGLEEGAGSVAIEVTDAEFRVRWRESDEQHSVVFERSSTRPNDVLTFTYFAGASVDEIIASLLAPDGMPLLTGLVRDH